MQPCDVSPLQPGDKHFCAPTEFNVLHCTQSQLRVDGCPTNNTLSASAGPEILFVQLERRHCLFLARELTVMHAAVPVVCPVGVLVVWLAMQIYLVIAPGYCVSLAPRKFHCLRHRNCLHRWSLV
jgi:hypothetical protein